MSDFRKLVDLASERLGGRAIAANDEFFAPKSNLLKPSKPIFIEGKFTSRGKWMDGWETRRRRTPGYDWCIVRLGLPGIIRGVVVDTSYFKGNYPARVSLEACALGGAASYAGERAKLSSPKTEWTELLPETPLAGDSQNEFAIENAGRFTHLRLKIYPDGGVARLRVHGEVVPDRKRIARPGNRPRRHRKRRKNPPVERRVFRRAPESPDARPRQKHGRRLGDSPQARPRPRLDHREARRAGLDSSR